MYVFFFKDIFFSFFFIQVIALHDTTLSEEDMPIDYFYSHNDMDWRNRKIQIGRRSGRFEVGCVNMGRIFPEAFFQENKIEEI